METVHSRVNYLEDIDHLFVQCPFVTEIWSTIPDFCIAPINGNLHFLHWIELILKYGNVYNKIYRRPLEIS